MGKIVFCWLAPEFTQRVALNEALLVSARFMNDSVGYDTTRSDTAWVEYEIYSS